MRQLDLLLFLVILTVYSFFVQYPNVNQNTRFDLARAIVEEQTVSIDRYHENTVDKSFRDGRWYADKAPGLSLLAVPAYGALLALQPVSAAAVWPGYPLYVLNAIAVALPAALLVLLLFRWLRAAAGNEGTALAIALVFGLGTLALPFATLFFGHMTSAALGFAAFYLVWRLRAPASRGEHSAAAPRDRRDGRSSQASDHLRLLLQSQTRRTLFAAGFLAGLATLTEYPCVLVAALLFLYSWPAAGGGKGIMWYVAGLLPPAVALLGYNTLAFGGPLQFSYAHSPTVADLGLLDRQLPTLSGLWAITLGERGLFTLSPIMLLAIPGLATMARRSSMRREFWLFTGICSGFFLIAWLYYRILGGVPGPRYLIPCLPFAAASIGPLLPRWKAPFTILAAASMGLMLIVTLANPMAPMTVANPLAEYWLPAFLQRSLVPTTMFLRFGVRSAASLVGLAAVLGVGAAGAVAWVKRGNPIWNMVLTSCLALALLLYLVIGFPIDLRHPFTIPPVVMGGAP